MMTTTAMQKTAEMPLRWPELNESHRSDILAGGGGLVDLWELSPVRLEDNKAHTEEIIDRLFSGNPLLCAGRNRYRFDTKSREDWRGGLAERQFICPNPMSAIRGRTRTGEWSKHTLSNTGPRRFLVVEFDSGDTDQHAALLIHLAGYALLVCAVHSANKSLHGWFYVQGQPEEKVLRFFRYAVSLGADSMLWSPCQFARMPDGRRDNGKRQTVFYLNYHPLEVRL